MNHKPNCSTNISCAVYHESGVCPDKKLCDCGVESIGKLLTQATLQEFDNKFGDNFVYWQEIVAEIQVGDPDFKSLKAFIAEKERAAFSAGLSHIAAKVGEIERKEVPLEGSQANALAYNQALYITQNVIQQELEKVEKENKQL